MKTWSARLALLKRHPWLLPTFGLVSTLLIAGLLQMTPTPSSSADFEIDTYIPAGHVLVPITVHNSENVDSMLGSYGMVDLYPIDENGQTSRRAILRGVKILRAPRNPSQFGILVAENLASNVIRSGSSFAVVVLNRKAGGTVLEKEPMPMKRKVILDEDSI